MNQSKTVAISLQPCGNRIPLCQEKASSLLLDATLFVCFVLYFMDWNGGASVVDALRSETCSPSKIIFLCNLHYLKQKHHLTRARITQP